MTISRRSLSVWARWRETEPDARADLVSWAGLSVADIYVLEQLTANLREAGEEADWFQSALLHAHHLRAVVAPALLDKLVLRHEDAGRLAKALCLQTPGRTSIMEQTLQAFALGKTRHLHGIPPHRAQTANVVAEPGQAPVLPTVYERVLEALDALRVNVALPLAPYIREAIADRVGTTPDNVISYVSRVRKERGCLIQKRGAR